MSDLPANMSPQALPVQAARTGRTLGDAVTENIAPVLKMFGILEAGVLGLAPLAKAGDELLRSMAPLPDWSANVHYGLVCVATGSIAGTLSLAGLRVLFGTARSRQSLAEEPLPEPMFNTTSEVLQLASTLENMALSAKNSGNMPFLPWGDPKKKTSALAPTS